MNIDSKSLNDKAELLLNIRSINIEYTLSATAFFAELLIDKINSSTLNKLTYKGRKRASTFVIFLNSRPNHTEKFLLNIFKTFMNKTL